MSGKKFIWLSTLHMTWLAHVQETPVFISAPVLRQLEEKGLLTRDDHGQLVPTREGLGYAEIAVQFTSAIKENPLMPIDARANLNIELHKKLRAGEIVLSASEEKMQSVSI